MGGKGGGPVATNDQMVAMQQQQAGQATEANAERNARLQYGAQAVNQVFQGVPSGSSLLDLSAIGKVTPGTPGTPLTAQQRQTLQGQAQQFTTSPDAAAYTPKSTGDPRQDAQAAAAANAPTRNASYDPAAAGELTSGMSGGTPASTGTSGSLANGYSWKALPDAGSGKPNYGLYDSGGNLVDSGSLSDLASAKIYTGGDSSNMTGGFGPDFYNKFNQSILDYQLPQEGKQYNDARSSLSYSLARAGQLNSSVAGMDIGNLASQDAINRAQIASGADQQTGALRNTIQQDQQSALNQLYSTEDPSVAANTAGNMVANAQLTKPLLNPAGALFAPITVGVGNAISGFTNPTAYINPTAGAAGATGTSTSSGNQSSGIAGVG